METVGPATARHGAPGIFIHNNDLVLHHDVLDVLFINAVSAEQLGDIVDALAGLIVILLFGGLGALLLLLTEVLVVLDVVETGEQIGQDEGVGIVRVQVGASPLAQVGLVGLGIDAEVTFLLERKKFGLARVLVKRQFGVVHGTAELGVLDQLVQLLVGRHRILDLEEQPSGLFDIALVDLLARVGGPAVGFQRLRLDEALNRPLEFVVLM